MSGYVLFFVVVFGLANLGCVVVLMRRGSTDVPASVRSAIEAGGHEQARLGHALEQQLSNARALLAAEVQAAREQLAALVNRQAEALDARQSDLARLLDHLPEALQPSIHLESSRIAEAIAGRLEQDRAEQQARWEALSQEIGRLGDAGSADGEQLHSTAEAHLATLADAAGRQREQMRAEADGMARKTREEVVTSLRILGESTRKAIAQEASERLEALAGSIQSSLRTLEQASDAVKRSIDSGIAHLREASILQQAASSSPKPFAIPDLIEAIRSSTEPALADFAESNRRAIESLRAAFEASRTPSPAAGATDALSADIATFLSRTDSLARQLDHLEDRQRIQVEALTAQVRTLDQAHEQRLATFAKTLEAHAKSISVAASQDLELF